MAQWTNLNWNNIFVNPLQLPVHVLCKISGPATGSNGRQASRQNTSEFQNPQNSL